MPQDDLLNQIRAEHGLAPRQQGGASSLLDAIRAEHGLPAAGAAASPLAAGAATAPPPAGGSVADALRAAMADPRYQQKRDPEQIAMEYQGFVPEGGIPEGWEPVKPPPPPPQASDFMGPGERFAFNLAVTAEQNNLPPLGAMSFRQQVIEREMAKVPPLDLPVQLPRTEGLTSLQQQHDRARFEAEVMALPPAERARVFMALQQQQALREAAEREADRQLALLADVAAQDDTFAGALGKGVGALVTMVPQMVLTPAPAKAVGAVGKAAAKAGLGQALVKGAEAAADAGLRVAAQQAVVPEVAEVAGGFEAQGSPLERAAVGAAMGAAGAAGGLAARAVAPKVLPVPGEVGRFARGAFENVTTGLGFGLAQGGVQQGLADALLAGVIPNRGAPLANPAPAPAKPAPAPQAAPVAAPKAAPAPVAPPVEVRAVQPPETPQERPVAPVEAVPVEPASVSPAESPLPRGEADVPVLAEGQSGDTPDPRSMVPRGARPLSVEDPERFRAQRRTIEQIGKHPKNTRFKVQLIMEELQDRLSSLGSSGPTTGRGTRDVGGGVLGLFRPHSEEIALGKKGDIYTQAHELSHAMQKRVLGKVAAGGRVGISNLDPFLVAHAKELAPLSYTYDPRLILVEGFAEWGKTFLTMPDEARRLAPKTYDDYWQKLAEHDNRLGRGERHKRLTPIVRRLQDAFRAIEEGDPTMINTVYPDETYEWQTIGEKAREGVRKFVALAQDSVKPLKEIVDVYKRQKGRGLSADKDPYMLVSAGRAAGHRVGESFVWEGPVNPRTGTIKEGGKPLSEILSKLEKWEHHKDFDAYIQDVELLSDYERTRFDDPTWSPADKAWANRTRQRIQNDLRSREQTIQLLQQAVKKREEQFPQFQQMAAELRRYIRDLQDYAVGMGLWDDDMVKQMRKRHPYYVPLKRMLTKEQAAQRAGSTFVNVPLGTKRRTGASQLAVKSPLISIMEMSYVIPRLAERAKVGQALGRLLDGIEGADKYAARLERPPKPINLRMSEIAKQLEALGFDADSLDADDILTIWRPDQMFGFFDDGIVRYRDEKGRVNYWRLKDPLLQRAIADYDVSIMAQAGLLGKAAILAANAKRTLIGLTGTFTMGNFMRDLQSGVMNTGRLPAGLAKAYIDILTNSEAYLDYVRSGGAMGSLQNLDLKKLYSKQKDIVEGRPWKSRRLGAGKLAYLRLPIEFGRYLQELSEAPGRLEQFNYRMANPLPEDAHSPLARRIRAAVEAREARVDFSKRGASQVVRAWTSTTAYLNPGIQGIAKFASVMREAPLRAAIGAGAYIGAGVILYAWNTSDPWRKQIYDRLPAWEKATNFVFIGGSDEEYQEEFAAREKAVYERLRAEGKSESAAREEARLRAEAAMARWAEKRTFKWAKPQDWGMFATAAEESVAKPIMGDQTLAEGFKKTMEAAGDMLVPPLLPEVARPFTEIAANRDFFRGEPIVSPYQDLGLPPELQYDDNTSELAKWAGRKFGVSPRKVDHLISLGVLRDANKILDLIVSEEKREQLVADPLGEMPWFGSAWRRINPRFPTRSAEPLNRFYEVYKDMRKARNGLSDLLNRKGASEEEAQAYIDKNRDKIETYLIASRCAEAIAECRKEVIAIKRGSKKEYQGLTPDEKQHLVDTEVIRMVYIAEDFLELVDGPKE